MPSPAKKRKLDSNQKPQTVPSRGLEYFFAKQQQHQQPQQQEPQKNTSDVTPVTSSPPTLCQDQPLTDEELARKLQAEWDLEAAQPGPGDQGTVSKLPSEKAESSSLGQETIRITSLQDSGSLSSSTTAAADKGSKNGFLTLQSTASAVDAISESIPFDESPLTFDPSKYASQLRNSWANDGGDASYGLLTRCFVLVNGTQSRIKIVDTLVNCLRVLIEADPESLLPAVWLTTNAISPPYISLELGLGGSALSKALKQVCGLDGRALKALYDRHGDAGDVAFEAKKKQSFTLRKPKPLSIKGVYQSLVKIANSQGQGSGEVKQRIVDRLLQDARGGEESRYVMRTLCQHLRIGAVKTTMLIALSRAFLLARPHGATYPLQSVEELRRLRKEELSEVWGRAEETVKACFARRPNYNDLIPLMLEIGVCDELLLRSDLTLHVPLRPMLGSITRDLSEMLTKLQGRDFACEFKYDGQRAQVHCDENGRVSIFSRHLEVMTDKYPDLVALVPKIRGEGVSSFVMEGEVVAVDSQTGELKNFQTLTNRARKDVAIGSIVIEVCLFSFDLMYLNGQPLLDRPFRERRELLRSLFVEIPHRFTWVRSLDATSQDSEAVQAFFKSAIDAKCEGIMVKILDNLPNLVSAGNNSTAEKHTEVEDETAIKSPQKTPKTTKVKGEKEKKKEKENPKTKPVTTPSSRRKPLLATYEPDKRLDSWLKVKKDYDTAASDTLDLVPVAGWHGQGRKSQWWSPILLAVRDSDTGGLQVVCKCISGFTDSFYKANREFYDPPSPTSSDSSPELEESESEEEEGNENKSNSRKAKNNNNTHPTKPPYISYPPSAPQPDIWFEPQEVWEVAFADITLSPTYTAASDLVVAAGSTASHHKGLSLRFPRFLRVRSSGGRRRLPPATANEKNKEKKKKKKNDEGEEERGEGEEQGGGVDEKGDKSIEEASDAYVLAGLWRKQEMKASSSSSSSSSSIQGQEQDQEKRRKQGEGGEDDDEEEEEEEDEEE